MEKEYLLNQYEQTMSDRKDIIREMNLLERSVLIVSGLIWSWLLTQNTLSPKAESFAYFLPLFVSFIAAIRVKSLNTELEKREDYLRNLEKQMLKKDGLFNYLLKTRTKLKNGKRKKTELGLTAYAFWAIIILTNVILIILVKM